MKRLTNVLFSIILVAFLCAINFSGCSDSSGSDTPTDTTGDTPTGNIIAYDDFSSSDELNLIEDAAVVSDILRINPSEQLASGAAWYKEKQNIADGFVTDFEFRISEIDSIWNPNWMGGDGFAFVIQNESATAMGDIGGGMGYMGITNSVAVEFDTWYNSEYNDPNENHISIHTNGTGENSAHHDYSLGSNATIFNMSDGVDHTIRIAYSSNTMDIYYDNLTTPFFSVIIDIEALLDLDAGCAWVGFTAAGYNAWENHDINSWYFTEDEDL